MSVNTTRQRVLQLYREILRTGRKWVAAVPEQTQEDRDYIASEARRLFKRHKNVTDEEEIKMCIKEAEQRIEIGRHYQNPYPRHINLPQNTLPPGTKRKLKGREKAVNRATPAYFKSYVEETDKKDS